MHPVATGHDEPASERGDGDPQSDESLHAFEDYDLFLRLAANGARFVGVSRPLLIRHEHHGRGAISGDPLRLRLGLEGLDRKWREAILGRRPAGDASFYEVPVAPEERLSVDWATGARPTSSTTTRPIASAGPIAFFGDFGGYVQGSATRTLREAQAGVRA